MQLHNQQVFGSLTRVTDGIQSFHSVQVVVTTFKIKTGFVTFC